MQGQNKRLPTEIRQEIRRRFFRGDCVVQLARELGTTRQSVYRITSAMPFPPRSPSKRALTLQERHAIDAKLKEGIPMRAIARQLGRAHTTISREVKKQRTAEYYAPHANDLAEVRAARPKERKLELNAKLCVVVEEGLRQKWSPEQISRRLKSDYAAEPGMRISHETIYKTLFVQTKGALKKELTKFLRTQRTKRAPLTKEERRGRFPDMLMISQRPAEVADRAVPGHWEGDLIVGAGNQSFIATLVERKTRFAMLAALPDGSSAESVRVALTKKILQLPEALRGTLTWDQGREMAQHTSLTVDTKIRVYFCDPSSPWQRGTNENTNGLLRQYFPKGTDLSRFSQAELDEVAAELNGRPRKTLNWAKPSEVMSELVL